jgi:hypothetical protein
MIFAQSGLATRSKDGVNRYAVNDYQSEMKPSTADNTVQIKVRGIDKGRVSNDIQDIEKQKVTRVREEISMYHNHGFIPCA